VLVRAPATKVLSTCVLHHLLHRYIAHYIPYLVVYGVGIATRYGLDGLGIESRWGRDFPHPSRPVLRPTQPPTHCVPGLSRGVKRPGHGVDHPPHQAPRLNKE